MGSGQAARGRLQTVCPWSPPQGVRARRPRPRGGCRLPGPSLTVGGGCAVLLRVPLLCEDQSFSWWGVGRPSRSKLGKGPSMCSRRAGAGSEGPGTHGGQREQKSTRGAPCARTLECETSLGAISGHVHSHVQRQALGGWEPPGDLGLLSS